MPYFEGKDFSPIQDTMPSHQWDEAKFFSDWETQIRATNSLYTEADIQIAKEAVIKNFYDTYVELLGSLNAEKLPEADATKLIKQLNLAMINVLEYGQRRSQDIVSSLDDRKLKADEKNAELFNEIIDHLILEVGAADTKFSSAREKLGQDEKK